MRWVVAVVAACTAGCFFFTPPIKVGSGKSSREAQQQQRTELTPPELVPIGQWTRDVRPVKIHVWADDEYRAQNVHWEKTFGESLAYANAVLAPELGIRLEATYQSWDHHAPGTTLSQQLAELAKQDAGDGAFAVIGLTSSLSLVSATFEQLGVGSLPGHHIMLRGYAGVFEREAFDRIFKDLPVEERESLYQARRRHKTTAVLLHELGHNLGVAHEIDNDTIMNAMYSEHSSSFSKPARETMLASIEARLAGREPRMAAAIKTIADERHAQLVITLTASGKLVDGRPISDADLDVLLRNTGKSDPDTEVIVKKQRGLPASAITDLFDRAKAAGLQRLSMSSL